MLVLIIVGLVLLVMFLIVHSKSKSPAKTAVANMVAGVLSLVLFAPVVSASVNIYTVFAALTMGVPGTALVVLGTVLVG